MHNIKILMPAFQLGIIQKFNIQVWIIVLTIVAGAKFSRYWNKCQKNVENSHIAKYITRKKSSKFY